MKPGNRIVRLTACAALFGSIIALAVDRVDDARALTTAGTVIELQVTGRAGVPANASAVVLNLTAVDSNAPGGYVTAYPCGTPRPDASNLNYGPGNIVANSATVPIGTGGKVCLYTYTATNLIADINGWYPAGADFTTTTPTRLHDTRTTAATPSGGSPSPSAPAAAAPGQFVETFDGNAGLSRFDFGVYHRDDGMVAQTQWQADHDHAEPCGDPNTSRTIHRNTDEWIFVCRDHLMTSIGDTSGYSTGYFSPKQTFTGQTKVSWDVNMTDLMGRQWWEVLIVPAAFNSGKASCPQCAVMSWLSPDPSGLPAYPAGSVMVGNGPFGGDIKVVTNGVDRGVRQHYKWRMIDPEGAGSKAIRRPFTITDNRNGTITVDYAGIETYTVPGSFPAGGFKVVFKDHNYTPDKDGTPVGHTWHWDSIAIR